MKAAKALTLSLIAVCALAGANANETGQPRISESKILTLFHKVIGLRGIGTITEVREILGEPIEPPMIQKDGSSEWWYLRESERDLRDDESRWYISPWGSGGVVVYFDKDGFLTNARFNPQWVEEENILEYRRRYGAEETDPFLYSSEKLIREVSRKSVAEKVADGQLPARAEPGDE